MKTNGTCKYVYQTLPAVMSNFKLKFKGAKQNSAKKKTKKKTNNCIVATSEQKKGQIITEVNSCLCPTITQVIQYRDWTWDLLKVF